VQVTTATQVSIQTNQLPKTFCSPKIFAVDLFQVNMTCVG